MNLVEHQYSPFGIGNAHRMIKHPVVASFVRDDLRIVTGPYKGFIFMDQKFVVIVQHRFTLLVQIRTEQRTGSSDHRCIRTLHTFTAATNGGKQIVISVMFMNVSTFVCSACNLPRLFSLLQSQPVTSKLDGINSAKATPKKLFLPVIIYIERVD